MLLRFVPTSTTGVLTTFGKFTRLVHPGLRLYIPVVQQISLVSNRLQENAFQPKVRTKDKAFVHLDTAVQYRVYPGNTERALFRLQEPTRQMQSFIENSVRQHASVKTLDELYETQAELAQSIRADIAPVMEEAGYTIENVLVRDVVPPASIEKAMNAINASERHKIAAQNEGEAEKIRVVLKAEGDAERKRLQGKGISDMRRHLINGWSESIAAMSSELNIQPERLIDFVVDSLHLDTIGDIGRSDNTKTLFLSHAPGSGSVGGKRASTDMLEALEAAAAQPQGKSAKVGEREARLQDWCN